MVKLNFYWKLHCRIKIHDTTVLSVLKLFKVIEFCDNRFVGAFDSVYRKFEWCGMKQLKNPVPFILSCLKSVRKPFSAAESF